MVRSRNHVDFHKKNLEFLRAFARRAEQAVVNAARRSNAICPVNSLPDELLLRIFSIVMVLPDLTLPEDEEELKIRYAILAHN